MLADGPNLKLKVHIKDIFQQKCFLTFSIVQILLIGIQVIIYLISFVSIHLVGVWAIH